jgi:hypothetical protein
MLPEDVSSRLRYESRRRGVSVAAIVREAVERHLPVGPPEKPLSFVAIGEGTPDGSERVGEIVRASVRERLARD